MGQAVWQTDAGGVLSSELAGFRIVVERSSDWVRYRVHRHQDSPKASGRALIASGNEDSVPAAMLAAERVAERHAGASQTGNASGGHHAPAGDPAG